MSEGHEGKGLRGKEIPFMPGRVTEGKPTNFYPTETRKMSLRHFHPKI